MKNEKGKRKKKKIGKEEVGWFEVKLQTTESLRKNACHRSEPKVLADRRFEI